MPILSEHLCPYLTGEVLTKCKAAGIRTVLEFISHDAEALSHKTLVPYKVITGIRYVLLACHASSYQTADSLYNELLSSVSILNTGHSSLDEFLDGGIYTNEITEIHGLPGAGKTQLCLSFLSNLILETGKTAIYIDTNGNFASCRLVEFFQYKTQNSKEIQKALSMVHIINIHDVFGLFKVICYIKEKMKSENDQFFSSLKLIIIDSITTLIAPCIGGQQKDGMGIMMNIAEQLKVLCSELSLAVVIINNTVRAENTNVKPALGRYWKHVPSVILCINIENRSLSEIEPLRKILLVKSCRKSIAEEVVMQFVCGNIEIVDKIQCS